MKAYIDCISGVSGDMLLAALIDLGYPVDSLNNLLKNLGLNCVVSANKIIKAGIESTKIEINNFEEIHFRNLKDIKGILYKADIESSVKDKVLEIFEVLGSCEARVHGCHIDEVHFHEIGAVDTIIDIAGVIAGLNYLGINEVVGSPMPISRGFVKTEHGLFPVPSPAVSYLLENVPVYGINEDNETITPTGMAILKVISKEFGVFPQMIIQKVGYGAGTMDLNYPNVLRIWLGDNTEKTTCDHDSVIELQTNIDDMNPQWHELLMERLFERGALDVCFIPAQFKKNRQGALITVICHPSKKEELSGVIFNNSTTSGIRISLKERMILKREEVFIDTPFGNMKGKAIKRNDKTDIYPEYNDLKRIATEKNTSIEDVYRIFFNSLKSHKNKESI